MKITIREIEPMDNPELARIIRSSLEEFNAHTKGTVYYDDSTDHPFELFQTASSKYYVAVLNNEIAGGAGIFPTEGLPEGVSELVKMYLIPQARGLGIGSALIKNCFEYARAIGIFSL
jgi:putative acetyltransferase